MNNRNLTSIKLNPYQYKFIYDNKKFHFLKSGWGAGKSLALIISAIRESELYPENLGVIFRKEYVDLRDSTIKDFEKHTGLVVNSSREAILKDGSIIMFRHIEEINNIQNINLGWFGIEQAEELDTDNEFYMLWGRLRRENSSLKGYVVSSAKGHNWIYKIKQTGLYLPSDTKKENRLDIHLSARTYENVHNLPAEYVKSLEVLKLQKPAMYNRFVLNSDDEADISDIIINYTLVRDAVNRKLLDKDERIIVVCDPARFGDDETVCYVLKDYRVIAQEIYTQKSTMETVGKLIILKKKYKAGSIVVDSIGVGAGIVDRLNELDQPVFSINSAEKSKDEMKYKNLRAEMWFNAFSHFYNSNVSIPDDEILIDQLSQVKYKTDSAGRLQVENKEEIKKRIGRSSDRADALVMGLYGLDSAIMENEYNEVVEKYQRSINMFEYTRIGY